MPVSDNGFVYYTDVHKEGSVHQIDIRLEVTGRLIGSVVETKSDKGEELWLVILGKRQYPVKVPTKEKALHYVFKSWEFHVQRVQGSRDDYRRVFD